MTGGAEAPAGGISVLIRGARVVTPAVRRVDGSWRLAGSRVAGAGPLRGAGQGAVELLPNHDVLVSDGKVAAVGRELLPPAGWEGEEVDARGRVLLPGFVDAHTHACWAGNRLGEWERRLEGASYEALLAQGGGILSTVRAVREATEAELQGSLERRILRARSHGTTTLEVKSGYGLDLETELRMLRAVLAADTAGGTVLATALLGHAVDPAWGSEVDPLDAYAHHVVEEILPAVSRAAPGAAVDAYCEVGAWSVHACERLLLAARDAGHPVRVHADQFRDLGMTPRAVALGARSVDHLEASNPETLRILGASATQGVLLPISGFHLDDRWADGRALIEAGGAVVVASNWNPGSAPSPSIPLALALAVRKCGLTVHEALVAVTWNAACLLQLPDRGWIGPGARADLILLGHDDERELAHTVGENPVDQVFVSGLAGDRNTNPARD